MGDAYVVGHVFSRLIVFDLDGTLIDSSRDLADSVNELLAEGYKKILLNLCDMDYIDSNGLGELVQSLKTSKRFGASLR